MTQKTQRFEFQRIKKKRLSTLLIQAGHFTKGRDKYVLRGQLFQVKFRWLASIYDVLRDSKKREIYDRVLVEGLPNWKNPVFYYRRMRKIGLFEGVVYTLILTSLIQYAMHWASYFERKYTLQVRTIHVTFFKTFSTLQNVPQ